MHAAPMQMYHTAKLDMPAYFRYELNHYMAGMISSIA